MENENVPLTKEVEEEIVKMNGFERIIGMFVSPVKTLKNIKEYPTYLSPILVFLIAGIVMAIFAQQITAIVTEENSLIFMERYGADFANATALINQGGEQAAFVNAIAMITAAASMLVGPYISAFISALVLLIITKITNGTAKLNQYYSMYLHISIVTYTGVIITTLLMVLTNSSTNALSLAIFYPDGNITSMLYNFLQVISIFGIWQAILVFFGVKVMNNFSTQKAATIVIILFLLSIAIGVISSYSTVFFYDIQFNSMKSIAG